MHHHHAVRLCISLNVWNLQLLIAKWFLKPLWSCCTKWLYKLLTCTTVFSTSSADCTYLSKSYSFTENLNVFSDMNNTEKLSPCICLNTPQNKERKVVIHLQLGKKKKPKPTTVGDVQASCSSCMSFHLIFTISCMCKSLQFSRFSPVSQSSEQDQISPSG